MKKHFASNQLESKYGGTAPNATIFWPPCFPPSPFQVEGDPPDKFLTSISTYHLYNPVGEVDISSDMGNFSEHATIVMPCNDQKNYSDESFSVQINMNESDCEPYEGQESIDTKICLVEMKNKKCLEAYKDDAPFHEKSVEFEEEKIKIIDDTVVSSKKPTGHLVVKDNKEINSSSNSRKFCNFCSKTKCIII